MGIAVDKRSSMATPDASTPIAVVGRYLLHAPVAQGGMATIHIARLTGAEGFSRIVAAKRLHPQFARDAEFVSMFLDEARIASRIRHPNVVPVLDVVASNGEVILVQEYVHGVPLNVLLRTLRNRELRMPVRIAVAIAVGILSGLHAAHEAHDELGGSLEIVHRDVSPQNILVAIDGTPKLLDFGIAKARSSVHVTREGNFKGKVAYMAPEQIGGQITRSVDVYALGVVLWECLVGRRLRRGVDELQLIGRALSGDVDEAVTAALAGLRATMPPEQWRELEGIDGVVMKSLAVRPDDRFTTAAEMQTALASTAAVALPQEIAQWVKEVGRAFLDERDEVLSDGEASWRRQRDLGRLPSLDGDTDMDASSASASLVSGTRTVGESPTKTRETRWRAPLLIVAVTLLGVVALSLVLLVLLRRNDPVPAAPSGALVPSVSAPLPAAPSGVLVPSAPLHIVEPTPNPSVSPEASPRPPAPASLPLRKSPAPSPIRSAAAVLLPAPSAAASSTSPTSAPSTNCTPPFYFEGAKKVFKSECL